MSFFKLTYRHTRTAVSVIHRHPDTATCIPRPARGVDDAPDPTGRLAVPAGLQGTYGSVRAPVPDVASRVAPPSVARRHTRNTSSQVSCHAHGRIGPDVPEPYPGRPDCWQRARPAAGRPEGTGWEGDVSLRARQPVGPGRFPPASLGRTRPRYTLTSHTYLPRDRGVLSPAALVPGTPPLPAGPAHPLRVGGGGPNGCGVAVPSPAPRASPRHAATPRGRREDRWP